MNKKQTLVMVVGPTAIGKSSLSIELAKKLNGEIVSADSMQIYKYMNIGTAKIKEEEKEGILHYLIDEISPDVEFSVSDFQKRAKDHIDNIVSREKLPIVVGGTGLYINSLIYDLDFTTSVSNWKLRDEYTDKAEKFGNECIHNKLKEVDPISAKRIHLNDTKRIIRALEIYEETGKPMSEYYEDFRKPKDEFKLIIIGLNMERERLYARIGDRVDKMIEEGLVEEVKSLMDMGYHKNLTSMKGIGYKEIISYLNSEYGIKDAIEILKRETRRYAKRQLTWFRREEQIYWINVDEFSRDSDLIEHALKYVEDKL